MAPSPAPIGLLVRTTVLLASLLVVLTAVIPLRAQADEPKTPQRDAIEAMRPVGPLAVPVSPSAAPVVEAAPSELAHGQVAEAHKPETPKMENAAAGRALELLREGNKRFAAGTSAHPNATPGRVASSSFKQVAFAMVVAGADSQMPVERVFDRGVGELYVLRSSGNAATAETIASVELGIAQTQAPLIVVLGNAKCPVISELVEDGEPSAVMRRVAGVTEQIQPVIEGLRRRDPSLTGDELKSQVIDANVQASIARLLLKSPILHGRAVAGSLEIRGGVFDPATGEVRWLPPHPAMASILKAKPVDAQASGGIARGVLAIQSKLGASGGAASTTAADESKISATGVFKAPSEAGAATGAHVGAEFGKPRSLSAPELAMSTHTAGDELQSHKGPPTIPGIVWELTAGLSLGVMMIGLMASARLSRLKQAGTVGMTAASKLSLVLGMSTAALIAVVAVGGSGMSRQSGTGAVSPVEYERGAAAELVAGAFAELSRAGAAVAAAGVETPEESADLINRYNNTAATVRHRLARVTGVEQPQVLIAVTKANEALSRHVERVRKLEEARAQIANIRQNQLEPVGARIGTLVSELATTARADGDIATFEQAEAAVSAVSAIRGGAGTGVQGLRDVAKHATLLVVPIRALTSSAVGAGRRAWAQEASDALEYFATRATHAAGVMEDARVHTAALIDEEPSSVLAAGAQLASAVPLPVTSASVGGMRAWFPIGLLGAGGLGLLCAGTIGVMWVLKHRRSARELMVGAAALATGDLSAPLMNSTATDELGAVSRSIDGAATSMRSLLGDVSLYSSDVSMHASEIASSAEHMIGAVTKVIAQAEVAAGKASEMGVAAEAGGQVVTRTVEGMRMVQDAFDASSASVEELGRRGVEIGQLLSIIHDIAHRSNLLALDTAIAAARSGPASEQIGKIAVQMRQLAEQSTSATEQAAVAIKSVQEMTQVAVDRTKHGADQARLGAELAGVAEQRLRYLFDTALSVAELTRSVTIAGEEAGASASQSASASAQLAEKAQTLSRLIPRYRMNPSAGGTVQPAAGSSTAT